MSATKYPEIMRWLPYMTVKTAVTMRPRIARYVDTWYMNHIPE